MSQEQKSKVVGYLPDDRPGLFKMIFFALQQVIVMFPATVLVAVLTKFDIGVTVTASGLATIAFLLITRRRIPLYYGSSFSYIGAVQNIVNTEGIGAAQCGIVGSGFVSIIAGGLIRAFGQKSIKKILPPIITGSVAIVIGLSLAGSALGQAQTSWTVAGVTLIATILFSVYLRGVWSQLPILLGVAVGYIVALCMGQVDFSAFAHAQIFEIPHFQFPKWSPAALLAIMPVAIATIPESTAHLYQIDLYVNNLAKKLGRKKEYPIANLLGQNLMGDGLGDIVSGLIGGPAGTNYGENNSLMAITRNFSVPVLLLASCIAIALGFLGYVAAAVRTIPVSVIGGVSIYLFGIIGLQGIALMISEKVDLFNARTLAVGATILILGLATGGIITVGKVTLPAIATAAIAGILLNLIFTFIPDKAQETVEAE
ncbi:MAG TPA: solute carrier family 23 protein [Bacillota bacterium]|nr:solute carrier family 23 protein [Bacillota bacterium]